jgi:hypothetical protein
LRSLEDYSLYLVSMVKRMENQREGVQENHQDEFEEL